MSSAQQKVQQHPAFQQAQAKAHYYLAQLDKEVRSLAFQVIFVKPNEGPLMLRTAFSSPSILFS
jgi:receptor expression-enhancing protein 5/6